MRDYDIESDLKQEKFQNIKLVQGDKGNKIKINVFEDGQTVSLAGCSITAKYKRSDGEVVDGTVTNVTDNYFYAVMNSNITKVAGTLKMLFRIEKDDVKVSTFMLLADVREGIGESTGSSGGSTGGGEVTIDFSDYYKKSETYSKAQIDSQFKDIDLSKYVTKDELTQGGTVTFRDVSNNEIFTLGTSSSGEDTPTTPTNYTITNNLTNCINSNNATTIEKNTSYQANITANDGYSLDNVIVVMGGNDVTSSAYNNGIINIGSVTGNLIITASATKVSTLDIPDGNLLAYYDMSKDLVDGKIQDLSNAGQNLTLESSAKLENGYLMNNGAGGATATYTVNPVITPTTVDVSSGYTVFAVVSDAKQSDASPIFSTEDGAMYSQLCTFQNGLLHYSQGGFNNSASATQTTSDKCIVALSWLPSGNDTIYINGVQKYQATTKVTKIHNKLYLLNGYSKVTSLKLHKIALYKGELSSSDIATISNTLLGGNV